MTQEIVSLPSYDPAGPDPTDGVAERDRMTTALAELPPRMRAVLVLRYAEDLSEAATAELMGCAVSTVRSQTVRGLAKLRAALGTTATITVLEAAPGLLGRAGAWPAPPPPVLAGPVGARPPGRPGAGGGRAAAGWAA